MSVLRLYLRGGWPDDEAALPWALQDDSGNCLRHGDDAPGAWPRAARLELVLPAGRTLFTALRLPGGRALAADAIGFALEERLANEPAANLYALGTCGADGLHQVAVCEALSLRRAVAMLRQLGRLVDRILPEESLLPAPAPDHWALMPAAGGWMVRTASAQLLHLPTTDAALLDALLPRLAASALPPAFELAGAEAGGLPGHWTVLPHPASDWRQGRAGAFNFASGELAAGRRWHTLWPPLRRCGRWLVLLLLAQLLLWLGQGAWYGWQKQVLSREIRSAVQPWAPQAMPGASALPMLRAVDRLRLSRGLPARDDALELMAALALLGDDMPAISSLSYDSGRLSLHTTLTPELLQRWRVRLAGRQLQLTQTQRAGDGSAWLLTREP